jgi:nitric oxide reductase NorD protein
MEHGIDEVTRADRVDVDIPLPRRIDDPVARYTMLARAIVGRPLRVTLGGAERSYTTGDVVYIGENDLEHARDTALVQSALIWAGSLDAPIMQRLLGRPTAARRYLAVEAPRALRALASTLPGAELERLARMGCDTNIHSSVAALKLALGNGSIADPPHLYGIIRPRRLLAVRPRSAGQRAGEADDGNGDAESDDNEELSEDEEALRLGLFGKLINGGAAGFSLSARTLKALGIGREPGASEATPGDIGHLRRSRGTTAADPVLSLHPDPVAADFSVLGTNDAVHLAGWAYPEWDFRQRRYLRAWCTVLDLDPDPGPTDARLNVSGAEVVRRYLARVGLGLQRRRHETSGDDLVLDAVIQSRVDLAAGQTPDERLYIDTRKTRRDLGVLLLLDVSGSSAESSRLNNNHQLQLAAAAALAHALVALGARVAIYGFRSQGRGSVHFLRVKKFDDHLDTRVHQRLGGLTPRWFTRLGPAIRHANRLLRTDAGTSNLLLAVLSDGFAYDAGYEDRYAAADCRRALEEARDDGIGAICLTLGSDTSEMMLDRVFGSAVHATGDSIEALAPQLGNLCRAALASADLRRRLGKQEGDK